MISAFFAYIIKIRPDGEFRAESVSYSVELLLTVRSKIIF